MQKNGTIAQSGTPQDLYNRPSNAYVAEIFGETNKFRVVVKNSKIKTPLGDFPVPNNYKSNDEVIHRSKQIDLL